MGAVSPWLMHATAAGRARSEGVHTQLPPACLLPAPATAAHLCAWRLHATPVRYLYAARFIVCVVIRFTDTLSQVERQARVSTSMIFKGMHNGRTDRKVLPLFSFDGGVVLHPGKTRVLCGYGADGHIDDSYKISDGPSWEAASVGRTAHTAWLPRASFEPPARVLHALPGSGKSPSQSTCTFARFESLTVAGCGGPRCDARNPIVQPNNCLCGFYNCGGSIMPWRAEDLGPLLGKFVESGARYTGYGSYTGYNEIVVRRRVCECVLLSVCV